MTELAEKVVEVVDRKPDAPFQLNGASEKAIIARSLHVTILSRMSFRNRSNTTIRLNTAFRKRSTRSDAQDLRIADPHRVLLLIFRRSFRGQRSEDLMDQGSARLAEFVRDSFPRVFSPIWSATGSLPVSAACRFFASNFSVFLSRSLKIRLSCTSSFFADKLMSRVGLHGKAFLPLMSSFAVCDPGIMARGQ